MRASWKPQRATAIALGGVAGATLRWAVVTSVDAGSFPWPVLALNFGGSLLLGILLAAECSHPSLRTLLHDGGGIGFCGGLTTFSTFSLEVVNLVRAGDATLAATYAIVSVVTAAAGVVVGAAAVGRVPAISLPLEEEP